MGECVLAGLLNAKVLLPEQIVVCNRTESKMHRLKELYSVECAGQLDLVRQCSIVIIGVKPWAVTDLLKSIYSEITLDKLFVSLAACVSISVMQLHMPPKAKIVRVMPNLPCFTGTGVTSVSPNSHTSSEEAELVAGLFGAVGKSFIIEESQIHGVIGAAGSSPAYVFMFIEAMSDAAVRSGIPRAQSYEIVTQAVLGAAKMMQEMHKTPGELKDMVCTPGGTTIEAVRELERGGFRSTVFEAVTASVQKSRELEDANNMKEKGAEKRKAAS